MKRIDFNEGWTFHRGAGTALEHTLGVQDAPETVTLPHDAMIRMPRDPDAPSGNASGYYPCRTVHYTKEFVIDDCSGMTFLEFEGVYMNASVLLNGEKVGGWVYGYTNFYVDLTGKLKIGQENTITVIADNSMQPNSRWYSGCGIYRNVWMVKTGKVKRSDRARLIRDGIVVFTGNINALKRFKDDVKEVGTNFECGISLTSCNDIKVGDIIETFEEIEVKTTL